MHYQHREPKMVKQSESKMNLHRVISPLLQSKFESTHHLSPLFHGPQITYIDIGGIPGPPGPILFGGGPLIPP